MKRSLKEWQECMNNPEERYYIISDIRAVYKILADWEEDRKGLLNCIKEDNYFINEDILKKEGVENE